MLAGKSLLAGAEDICRSTEKEAENSSKGWPKFNSKVRSYDTLKKAWDTAERGSVPKPDHKTPEENAVRKMHT
jgi:hypothetical protein